MKATIEPVYINGVVIAPPSKSYTQRAYAGALLHQGKTIIHNAGSSADEEAALNVIRQLGARVVVNGEGAEREIIIESNGVRPVSSIINCGESGLATRLFTPIAGLSDRLVNITGESTLLGRPMEGFGDVLPALGVSIHDFTGYLPFSLNGPMNAESILIDANSGSQFLSGLLFALCACAKKPLTIAVNGLKSKPYIDLTLEVLAEFGKPVLNNGYKEFIIDPAQFTLKKEVNINVEADWSSAAFMLVAGAIGGNVTVRNLNLNSKQADRAIIEVLESVGADMQVGEQEIIIKKSRMGCFDFDATHCPDLFPALAILASCCSGESAILGVHRLFYKESNRVESITQMLQDFAVPYSVEDDTLFVSGVNRLQGTIIDSYYDHRIVMAAAIGALRANSRVDINHSEVVNKSYPRFFQDLEVLRKR